MKVISVISGVALVIWSLPICFWVNKNYIHHNLIIVLGIIGFVAGFYLIWRYIKDKEERNECA